MTTPELKDSYPNAIRAIRLSKGLSQQALADLVGSSQPQIDRLERGMRRLTVDWLGKLSHALNVKASALFYSDDTFLKGTPPSKGSATFAPSPPKVGSNSIPLYPTVPHPSQAGMCIMPDVVIGSIRRPFGISDDADVFAFHNPSSAMSSRWDLGDLVFVDRNTPPVSGGATLLILGGDYGDRTALFCKSSYGPSQDLVGPNEANTKIYAFFNTRTFEWGDSYGAWFPIETVQARYMIYDWPQLLGL